ncbi:hypothetical protein Tco_0823728 [Tanacetum coccineum]|uniref:Uncharacterized protein n=1 Tax=Tanacetum coccineum TaxID=301880 RepID=A0ABQ5ANQ3_9ASTR
MASDRRGTTLFPMGSLMLEKPASFLVWASRPTNPLDENGGSYRIRIGSVMLLAWVFYARRSSRFWPNEAATSHSLWEPEWTGYVQLGKRLSEIMDPIVGLPPRRPRSMRPNMDVSSTSANMGCSLDRNVGVVRWMEHWWVCDGTQLGLLILHPVKCDPEQALFETMECPPQYISWKLFSYF